MPQKCCAARNQDEPFDFSKAPSCRSAMNGHIDDVRLTGNKPSRIICPKETQIGPHPLVDSKLCTDKENSFVLEKANCVRCDKKYKSVWWFLVLTFFACN